MARDWPAILADACARGVHGKALARELGVTATAVLKQCRRHGVILPKKQSAIKAALLESSARGISNAALARHLGVSRAHITQSCKRYGVTLRPSLVR